MAFVVTAVIVFVTAGHSKRTKDEYGNDYSSVGESFIGPNGVEYKEVRKSNDYTFVKGWLNVETGKEDIPCEKYISFVSSPDDNIYYALDKAGDAFKITFGPEVKTEAVSEGKKYDYISDSTFVVNDNNYKRVSAKDRDGCEPGWLNLDTGVEDVKSGKYDFVGVEDIVINGDTYIEVSIPGDDDYAHGYVNLNDPEKNISCAKYDFVNPSVEDDCFFCSYTKSGKVLTKRIR